MRRSRTRRRRLVAGSVCGAAVAAFVAGIAIGKEVGADGEGGSKATAAVSERWIDAAARLSPSQLAGQRIVVGFEGAEVPASVRKMVRAGDIAGVILFAENLPGRRAARRLIRDLQRIPRPPGLRDPLLTMIDQEGGLVKRLSGAPTVSAQRMGSLGPAFSRAQGRGTARNLRNVGFNVNLAPVLDIARPGGTIADTDRGFGSSPQRVAETAIPFARAMQGGGVAATGKHFPGLGPARLNTDFAVQQVDLSKRALRRIDEAPYRRFIAGGGQLVMLSTAIYPAFSPRPAAFARPIASGELRGRLGFEGVSITDALETVAVRDFGGPAKAGVAAAKAGVDLLLFTDPAAGRRAQRALLRGLRAGSLRRAAFETSVARVLRLRDGS